MKRCKHENAEHMMPGDSSTPDWCVQVYAEFEQCRCIECGAWLTLGPAVDTPDVEIEIRAAEIAALVARATSGSRRKVYLGKLGCDGAELAGWIIAQYDSDKQPEQPAEHAGYLARIIYEHGKEEA